jgi:hypothetical protein
MCSNHNPSGAIGGGDNLNPQHYRDFAIYVATVARYAHDHWEVDFTSVEPFNEPSSVWWRGDGRQEGGHISARIQAQIIPLLRIELDQRGLGATLIAASDESFFSQGLATWNSFSPEVRDKIEQFNVHCYQEKANPKYFVLAQYTRHILPGMSVLTSPDANTVAAIDTERHRLVLVTANLGPAREADYDLSGVAVATGAVTRWLTEPKGAARYERADVSSCLSNTLLKIELPADSVQTFEINLTGIRF